MSETAALREIGVASIDGPKQRQTGSFAGKMPPVHPHIPSLDGLRFLAALNVIVAHGYWFIVLLQQEPSTRSIFDQLIRTGANVGMTFFFVLSGFVIHFNYHKTVPTNASGKVDFFIARFARLYPLFLLVFGIDFFRLLWAYGYFSGNVLTLYDLFKPLPLYLTFTQTWWWWPIGATWAGEYYGTPITGATGVMWSLSTEAFFYFSYLFYAGRLSRTSGWRLAALGVAVAVYGLVFYIYGLNHSDALQRWAAVQFPDAAPDQFVQWLLFQSPWGRISEFLLGAVAAQAILIRDRPSDGAGKPERRAFGSLLTYGSLAALVVLIIAIYAPLTNIYGAIGTQCCASLVALFIYAAARYRSRVSGILSHSLMVKLGSASYSIYLLHFLILHDQGKYLVVLYPHISRWVIFFGLIAVTLIVSYLSYLVIEKPAIRWIRANFRPLKFAIWLPVTLALITLFCGLSSIQMRALARSYPDQAPGHISISSASFGENCDPKLRDNALGLMRRVCNGEKSCAFDYNVRELGDPAAGCLKYFQVLYSCGAADAPREYMKPFLRPLMRIDFACR